MDEQRLPLALGVGQCSEGGCGMELKEARMLGDGQRAGEGGGRCTLLVAVVWRRPVDGALSLPFNESDPSPCREVVDCTQMVVEYMCGPAQEALFGCCTRWCAERCCR